MNEMFVDSLMLNKSKLWIQKEQTWLLLYTRVWDERHMRTSLETDWSERQLTNGPLDDDVLDPIPGIRVRQAFEVFWEENGFSWEPSKGLLVHWVFARANCGVAAGPLGFWLGPTAVLLLVQSDGQMHVCDWSSVGYCWWLQLRIVGYGWFGEKRLVTNYLGQISATLDADPTDLKINS